jgi:hypothetical protein
MGYWHEAANSSSLQRCPNRAACAANRSAIIACQSALSCPTGEPYKALQCSRGYRGNLCGSCRQDQGYTQNRYFRCSRCLSTATSVVLLLLFALGACALVMFVSWRSWCDASAPVGWPAPFSTAHPTAVALEVQPLTMNDPATLGEVGKLSLADTFKVLIVYLQYLSIIGNLLVDWPPAAAFMFEAARAVFVTNSSRMISLGCIGTIGEGVRMLLMVLVPLLVVAAACWAMLLLLGRRPHPQPIVRHRSSVSADLLISTALIGVFLFYSVLVGTTMSAFSCMEAAGKLYWVRDLDLRCWHAEHLRASLALGLVGCAVLVVVVPAGTIVWLYRNKLQLQNPVFKRRYGFLYQLYKPQCCYWEGVVCLQPADVRTGGRGLVCSEAGHLLPAPADGAGAVCQQHPGKHGTPVPLQGPEAAVRGQHHLPAADVRGGAGPAEGRNAGERRGGSGGRAQCGGCGAAAHEPGVCGGVRGADGWGGYPCGQG